MMELPKTNLEALLRDKDIKLAFFDLDGTLINSKEEIGTPTRIALTRLSEAGVQVALATGRPYFGSKWVIDQLKIASPSMFFSGALIINPSQPQPLSQQAIPHQDLVRLIDFAKKEKLYLELYSLDKYVVEKLGYFTDVHESYLGVRAEQTDLLTFASSHKILKGVFITQDAVQSTKIDQFMKGLESIACAVGTGARHPGVNFHNITVNSASRANAFSELMRIYNLKPDQVMAFGDASSDVPFIQLAGVGVAMGNAPRDVQRSADYVTDSVDDDGVARVVTALLG